MLSTVRQTTIHITSRLLMTISAGFYDVCISRLFHALYNKIPRTYTGKLRGHILASDPLRKKPSVCSGDS